MYFCGPHDEPDCKKCRLEPPHRVRRKLQDSADELGVDEKSVKRRKAKMNLVCRSTRDEKFAK